MKQVEDLIKARETLEKAQKEIPQNLHQAAERLSKDVNVDYYSALKIIDCIFTDYGHKQEPLKVKKIRRPAKRTKKNIPPDLMEIADLLNKKTHRRGGNRNPQDLADIKAKMNAHSGEKKECYRAAYVLFKHVNHWITKKDLEGLGVNLNILKNKRKITACLPTGYSIQENNRGYCAGVVKK